MAESSKNSGTQTGAPNSILKTLYEIFSAAICLACPDVADPPIDIALSGTNPKFGDYQCNSAMPIANLYKQLGK